MLSWLVLEQIFPKQDDVLSKQASNCTPQTDEVQREDKDRLLQKAADVLSGFVGLWVVSERQMLRHNWGACPDSLLCVTLGGSTATPNLHFLPDTCQPWLTKLWQVLKKKGDQCQARWRCMSPLCCQTSPKSYQLISPSVGLRVQQGHMSLPPLSQISRRFTPCQSGGCEMVRHSSFASLTWPMRLYIFPYFWPFWG
jgi:hypothetical protein